MFCKNKGHLPSQIIYQLINDLPTIEEPPKLMNILINSKGHGPVGLSIENELTNNDDGKLIGNTHSWQILSHFLTGGIIATDDNDLLHMKLLHRIGSFKEILIHPQNNHIENAVPVNTHQFGDTNTVCYNMGIIEPITYSLQTAFTFYKNEMAEFVKRAITDNNIALINRLYAVTRVFDSIVEEDISETAKECNVLIQDYFSDFFKNIDIHQNEKLSKKHQGRNEKCSCGSGKKYKHCCGKQN